MPSISSMFVTLNLETVPKSIPTLLDGIKSKLKTTAKAFSSMSTDLGSLGAAAVDTDVKVQYLIQTLQGAPQNIPINLSVSLPDLVQLMQQISTMMTAIPAIAFPIDTTAMSKAISVAVTQSMQALSQQQIHLSVSPIIHGRTAFTRKWNTFRNNDFSDEVTIRVNVTNVALAEAARRIATLQTVVNANPIRISVDRAIHGRSAFQDNWRNMLNVDIGRRVRITPYMPDYIRRNFVREVHDFLNGINGQILVNVRAVGQGGGPGAVNIPPSAPPTAGPTGGLGGELSGTVHTQTTSTVTKGDTHYHTHHNSINVRVEKTAEEGALGKILDFFKG